MAPLVLTHSHLDLPSRQPKEVGSRRLPNKPKPLAGIRTPARRDILVCLASGKQREPQRGKNEKGLSLGKNPSVSSKPVASYNQTKHTHQTHQTNLTIEPACARNGLYKQPLRPIRPLRPLKPLRPSDPHTPQTPQTPRTPPDASDRLRPLTPRPFTPLTPDPSPHTPQTPKPLTPLRRLTPLKPSDSHPLTKPHGYEELRAPQHAAQQAPLLHHRVRQLLHDAGFGGRFKGSGEGFSFFFLGSLHVSHNQEPVVDYGSKRCSHLHES